MSELGMCSADEGLQRWHAAGANNSKNSKSVGLTGKMKVKASTRKIHMPTFWPGRVAW